MYNIIVIRPSDSIADLRKIMSDELYRGFLAHGCNAHLIDLASPFCLDDFNRAVSTKVDFIFAFGQEAGAFCISDAPASNALGIPCVSFFIDAPYLYSDRFETKINNNIVTFMNKSQAKNFFKLCHTDYETSAVAFVPHAGITTDDPFTEEQFNQRSKRIFYVGSFIEYKDKPWQTGKDPDFVKQFIDDVYACINSSTDIDEAILYVLNQRGLTLNKDALYFLAMYTFRTLYHYEHGLHRMQILNHLIENGYETDIYGVNYPDSYKKYAHVSVKGQIHFLDLLKNLNNYKLTINPYHQSRGGHERIFNALANGCQCLGYKSSYYDEIFAGYEGVYFLPSKGDLTDSEIDKYIQQAVNETDFSAVKKTRQYVLDDHMWANRAKDVMDIFRLSQTKVVYTNNK